MSTTGNTESGFNIGTDCTITIRGNTNGAAVVMDGRYDQFDENDRSKLVTSTPFSDGGRVDDRTVPGGWSGSITVDRNNGTFGKLYAFLEANFYAGGVQQKFTMFVEHRSPFLGQAGTAFRHTQVSFHGYKPGSNQRDQMTKSRIEWASQERIDDLA